MENIFGTILKSYRHIINITQRQLAKKINTTKSCIGLYEVGKRLPNKDMIQHIAEKTDLKYEQLYIAVLLDKEKIDINTLERYIKIFKKGIDKS